MNPAVLNCAGTISKVYVLLLTEVVKGYATCTLLILLKLGLVPSIHNNEC